MAETRFHVRWPDGSRSNHYCPSHVVKKYLTVDEPYAIPEFVDRSRRALQTASERVRSHFGYPCGLAAAAIGDVERKAKEFESVDGASAVVERFEDF